MTLYNNEKNDSHYQLVQNMIEWLHENYQSQPDMKQLSHAMGKKPQELTHIFKQWAGITPMTFLQALTLDHARHLLREKSTILEASLDLGFSSPARLHDLFISHEAMSPGVYKAKGAGLVLTYGFHPSPFGIALLIMTEKGIAGLGFCEDTKQDKDRALEDMMGRWPNANFIEAPDKTLPLMERIFSKHEWQQEQPLKIVMIGTDFEIRVWETLLKIPFGFATTYGDIAKFLDKPKAARAVGRAVGKNPISFVVPCHRVLGNSGAITGYHWGITRKKAILGWETGLV